jgi:hypothetical protein
MDITVLGSLQTTSAGMQFATFHRILIVIATVYSMARTTALLYQILIRLIQIQTESEMLVIPARMTRMMTWMETVSAVI